MNAHYPSNADHSIEDLAEFDIAAAAPSNADDARRHARYPFRGRARAIVFPIDPAQGGEPAETEVVTTDLSRGGLSLLNRKELFPGQQVLLVLNDANRLLEVRWCCRVWAGLFAAGCAFVDAQAQSQSEEAELAE